MSENIRHVRREDGTYVVYRNEIGYSGFFDSEGTASIVAMNMTRTEVKREFEHIYSVNGQDRAVTTTDFIQYFGRKHAAEEQSREKTAEEKLAKIEELMHPGYWNSHDYRRNAVLKVLGSERQVWDRVPDEYAGR